MYVSIAIFCDVLSRIIRNLYQTTFTGKIVVNHVSYFIDIIASGVFQHLVSGLSFSSD